MRITVCNMENLDPMGIHTGESIVVAPSQTLNNRRIPQPARDRHQVRTPLWDRRRMQYPICAQSQERRLPRDRNERAPLPFLSALASKATGYPLAFVAAKLALGFTLAEIKNAVTKKTVAFFEPALDYVVVKIPRWDIHKFRSADRRIGTEMKSVGEVMAIGRSFPEALQKAVRMLNIGASGLTDYPHPIDNLKREIAHATDRRLFALYQFFKKGGSVDEAAPPIANRPLVPPSDPSYCQMGAKLKKTPLSAPYPERSQKARIFRQGDRQD